MKNLMTIIILYLLLNLSQVWALPICSGSPSYEGATNYWDNCIGTHSWSNGDKYVGEFKNNKFHGEGIYTFATGEKYVGEYKNGKRDGQGTITFANNNVYEGEFKNDTIHGQGTFIYTDLGAKYTGEYKDGKRNGQGTFTFADGRVWQGQWKNDEWVSGNKYAAGEYSSSSHISSLPTCPSSPSYEGLVSWDNCIGTYIWSNGEKYVGEFKDGNKHGQGIYTYADGSTYMGEYKYGILHGEGTYTYATGEKYVGEFKDNKRNGQGIFTWPDGESYEGEFKDEKRNGQGTFTFSDGRVWQGQWKNDEWVSGNKYAAGEYSSSSQLSSLPTCPGSPSFEEATYWNNCIGTYIWSNGDKYIGEYKGNNKHGKGTAIWSNGNKYVGEYKDNKRNGQGIFTWADGESYEGEFKDGRKHGYGTYTYTDGTVWQGQWRNDDWLSGNKYSAGRNNSPIKENNYKQSIDPDEIINAASGSGFIVSSSGHIVTNNHVIDGCDEVKVHQKGNTFKATIIEADYMNDLAIIKADITPSIVFSVSTQDADLLQDIYVAGYPFGATISSSIKVTKGIVSSLSGIGNNYSNMQIDAALQPGNSGGPILDKEGNVVGVAVAKLDLSLMLEEFGAVPEDTNFGIKSSILRTFLRANGINIKNSSDKNISRLELGQKISDGTLFISCWMTYAKIEELRTKKVMFENLK